ncbi:MAG: DUF4100 domain-containing protein [Bdellovibrionales bacterium]|nr:DUF4100 domain-containing protein [Bdellovibrionales bacterium]
MELKSIGPFVATTATDYDREKVAEELKGNSAFQRVIPPEASGDSTQEELKQGLSRLLDHFKTKPKKKRGPEREFHRNRSLQAYQLQADIESLQDMKGQLFHKSA